MASQMKKVMILSVSISESVNYWTLLWSWGWTKMLLYLWVSFTWALKLVSIPVKSVQGLESFQPCWMFIVCLMLWVVYEQWDYYDREIMHSWNSQTLFIEIGNTCHPEEVSTWESFQMMSKWWLGSVLDFGMEVE